MSDSSPNVDQLERIVAYLDGELAPEESAQVERQLAGNEAFRHELQSIERAWAALDELPLTRVDDKFSKTTLAMTVEVARDEVRRKTAAEPAKNRERLLAILLGAVAALVVGFAIMRFALPNPNRTLLTNLPVIRNVDLYSQTPDEAADTVSFLEALSPHRGRLLGPAAQEQVDAEVAEMARLETYAEREPWLLALPDAQRTTLLYKARRFRDLSHDEQIRMRAVHDAVTSSEQREELRETLVAYGIWLSHLPQAQQFELRQLTLQKRLIRIKHLVDTMRRDEALALTEEELRHLVRAARQTRPDAMRQMFDQLARPGRRNDDFDGQAQRLRRMLRELESGEGRLAELFESAVDALPQRVRPAFDKLPLPRQLQQLKTWFREAALLRGDVPAQELERFFAEEVDAAMREELLKLPPDEMQMRLRRLYRGFSPLGWDRPQGRPFAPNRDRPLGDAPSRD